MKPCRCATLCGQIFIVSQFLREFFVNLTLYNRKSLRTFVFALCARSAGKKRAVLLHKHYYPSAFKVQRLCAIRYIRSEFNEKAHKNTRHIVRIFEIPIK